MLKTFGKIKLQFPLKWFCAVWTFAILTPLIYFPAPGVLAGHPWKVELTLSLVLASAFGGFLIFKQNELHNFSIDRKVWIWIIAPFSLFILWSAASVFWANSIESVLHHTLVWAVYLTFFLFAAKIAANKNLLKISLISLSLALAAIGLQCIVEYTFSAAVGETFGFRFARYAEIYAAVLPLFLSFVLRLKKKHLAWAIILSSIAWLAVLFSMSRAAFLSSAAGLGIFFSLRLLTKTDFVEKRRLIFAALGLAVIAFLVQFPVINSGEIKGTTLTRLTTQKADDPDNSVGQNVRFLFAGVGLKMFADNVLNGVGADNFGLEFNKYRAVFSSDEKNKSVAGQQEALLPERAHDEYLQILAELGAVGGIIFLCFVFGIARLTFSQLKLEKSSRSNILTHAALAGIIAFLINSLFSSFSFRLMQNGIVFFFLLALLLKNYFSAKPEKSNFYFAAPVFRNRIAAVLIAFCLSLLTLSTLKASSQYFVYRAENEKDLSVAESYYEKAEMLDAANASATYSFGLRLLGEGKYKDSALQFRKSIEKGLNTTVCYSLLASAQILSGDTQSAEKTLAEAVEIFPFSTFAQVRYASVLKTNGKEREAAKHFQIAERINREQAETWRIFINQGGIAANKHAFANKVVTDLEKLTPAQAVPLILSEREILHPEEVVKINFNN
ncbi:MAG: O-antigen ligase family protein [Pyrinomonadaceae bacterium]